MPNLKAIPTNVITGFLGVGKTTAILHLLQQKPKNERWAVLVNEFGEVGIDGSLCAGQYDEQNQQVYIKEVPGGCMCCAAGLPMLMALNMLLAKAKPHRLLIEPTGLGHPQEVLQTLRADYNRELLDVQATITLVDARKIQDERYTGHDIFNQQLAVADIIVANKADLYQPHDFLNLLSYLEFTNGIGKKSIHQVENGRLEQAWLQVPNHNLPTTEQPSTEHLHDHSHPNESAMVSNPLQPQTIPEEGYLCLSNAGEGFKTLGWIFDSRWVFDSHKLNLLLGGINAERIKGVFITAQGVSAFNMADDVLSQNTITEAADSRIEIITQGDYNQAELTQALLDCVVYR